MLAELVDHKNSLLDLYSYGGVQELEWSQECFAELVQLLSLVILGNILGFYRCTGKSGWLHLKIK